MKKLSRNAARFVLVCLALFVILVIIASMTQNSVIFAAGIFVAMIGLFVRQSKIRCPYCGEIKQIKMMDILKWSADIHYECPTCGKIIEYDK